MPEKIDDHVKSLCGEYLFGPWRNPTNINVQKISKGLSDRNFRCSLKCKSENCDYPSDVIVHIYGGVVFGKDQSYKINGEAAESVLVNILSRTGLAPKVYGVFDGGRIEEYIPSTTCAFDDFENPRVNRLLAQKLAQIHPQTMPVSKVPKLVVNFKAKINRMLAQNKKTLDTSKFDVMAEFDWYEKIIQTISDQPVFTHGDVNPNNILIIRDENQGVKNVMLIDYENCTSFYRRADIANLFNLRCVRIQNQNGKPKTIIATEDFRKASTDIERQFLEEYIREWKSLNSSSKTLLINTSYKHQFISTNTVSGLK